MSLKQNIFSHRARKKIIIGSNKIAMFICIIYILLRIVYSADLTKVHFGLDIILVAFAWEIYISFSR